MKKVISNKYGIVFSILILIFLNILAHRIWFNPLAIVASGEWAYLYPDTIRHIQWDSWISSIGENNPPLGSVNFLPLQTIMIMLAQIVVYLGGNQQISDSLLYYLPITIFGPLGSFLLLHHLTKSKFASFIGSLFFIFTEYILVWTSGGYPLGLAYMLTPFFLYVAICLLDSYSYKFGFSAVLFGSILLLLDLRLFFLVAVLLVFYVLYRFIFVKDLKIIITQKTITKSVIFLITIVAINFYLIDFAFSSAIKNAIQSVILDRSLIMPGYLFINNTLTTFYPFWTGNIPTEFYTIVVPNRYWIIPLYIFGSAFFLRKNKYLPFFFFSALVFAFLGKGPTSPGSFIYEFAFNHVPFFSVFRESSKFWQLMLLLYAILIAFSLTYVFSYINKTIKKNKLLMVIKTIIVLPLLLTIVISVKPAFNQKLGPGYISYSIPPGFLKLKNFLQSQPGYFRVLQIPTFSRFTYFSNAHPRLTFNQLPTQFRSLSPDILTILGVKYIVLPDDPYNEVYDGNSSKAVYKQALENTAGLKKVKYFGNTLVYENTQKTDPHIFAANIFNQYNGVPTNFAKALPLFNKKNLPFVGGVADSKTPKLNVPVNSVIDVSSCLSCQDYVVNQTAKFNSITVSQDGNYNLAILSYGISNATIAIDNNQTAFVKNSDYFNANNIFLKKGKHLISLNFARENLVAKKSYSFSNISHGQHEYFIDLPYLASDTPYVFYFAYDLPNSITATVRADQNTDFYFQYQVGTTLGNRYHAFENGLSNNNSWVKQENMWTSIFNANDLKIHFTLNNSTNSGLFKVKDLSLIANVTPQIMVYHANQTAKSQKLPTITFQQINPTHYQISVEGAKAPFYLIFNESYNPEWQAFIQNKSLGLKKNKLLKTDFTDTYELAPENNYDFPLLFSQPNDQLLNQHTMVNGFANAWYVNKQGNYTINLFFTPEKDYLLSLLISVSMFIAISLVTIVLFLVAVKKNSISFLIML